MNQSACHRRRAAKLSVCLPTQDGINDAAKNFISSLSKVSIASENDYERWAPGNEW